MNKEMVNLQEIVPSVINFFEITNLIEQTDRYIGCCPVHAGDNPTGFRLFKHGLAWRCYSHNCHEIFGKTLLGLIRGLLSRKKYLWSQENDKTVEWSEVYKLIKKEFNYTNNTNIYSNISNFSTDINQFHEYEIKRNILRKNLQFPCNFYISKGFKIDILDKYDVGICLDPRKKMFNRAVVPIYDDDYKFSIGCLGRSLYKKCENCKLYHSNKISCPKAGPYFIKWRNSNFDRKNTLYNSWFAKNSIIAMENIIICEGPADVWKLEQCGIHNSIAICGTEFTDNQLLKISKFNIKKMVLCLDNDEAGIKATKNIVEKCKRLFHIEIPQIHGEYKDIGEMPDIIIKNKLSKYVQNY